MRILPLSPNASKGIPLISFGEGGITLGLSFNKTGTATILGAAIFQPSDPDKKTEEKIYNLLYWTLRLIS